MRSIVSDLSDNYPLVREWTNVDIAEGVGRGCRKQVARGPGDSTTIQIAEEEEEAIGDDWGHYRGRTNRDSTEGRGRGNRKQVATDRGQRKRPSETISHGEGSLGGGAKGDNVEGGGRCNRKQVATEWGGTATIQRAVAEASKQRGKDVQ